jgi:ribosome-associated toxin RatA of RatAB toxin-antitoxin module
MAMDLVMGPRGRQQAAAWRVCARRLLLCVALFALTAGMPLAAPAGAPQVTVRDSAGVYQVAASFSVIEAPAIAIAVLTDFEGIPTFMPDMKTSTVLERTDAGTLVEQEAVARFMLFSKRVHLVLRVNDRDGTIRFRDECGKSFARYEGMWRVTSSEGGRTAIEYQLAAKPKFDVPAFVLTRFMKRDAVQMIERLQAEMTRRAAVSTLRPQ